MICDREEGKPFFDGFYEGDISCYTDVFNRFK